MKLLLRASLMIMLASTARIAPAANSILVTSAHLENGSPCLITVELQAEAVAVTGRWQNHKVIFFPSQNRKTWYALAGVDVEVAPRTYPLTVEVELSDGLHRTLHREIAIGAAPYAKVTLHVPDKFVEPDAEALKQIAADKIVKDSAFADTTPKAVWSGNFLPPLKLAPQSDSFGTRRVFNGKVASVHRGLDYHAKMGTEVAAINSGRVVLATPLYFEGGCVMIDHGQGLMSVYMHLSKIEVTVGDPITRGQIIALSGGSGRATGPHLHLGVRWQGSYLDPAKLFALNLPQPR
jgi:Peptidase family M23